MFEFLPKEISEGLDKARIAKARRKLRLRVQVGQAVFPVLRLWDDGMALDASLTPHLRGRVDVYDGARPILHCLIVATSEENGELVCTFKRATRPRDAAPLDFWRDENAAVAFLPRG